jgi:hypothetical protein
MSTLQDVVFPRFEALGGPTQSGREWSRKRFQACASLPRCRVHRRASNRQRDVPAVRSPRLRWSWRRTTAARDRASRSTRSASCNKTSVSLRPMGRYPRLASRSGFARPTLLALRIPLAEGGWPRPSITMRYQSLRRGAFPFREGAPFTTRPRPFSHKRRLTVMGRG